MPPTSFSIPGVPAGLQLLSTSAHVLAEGPVWSPESSRLSWIDIDDGRVFSAPYDGELGPITELEIGGVVGCALPLPGGRFLVALESWIGILHPGGRLEKSRPLIPTGRRFNDGKIDPQGRLVVGSLRRAEPDARQHLIRLERDGSITVLDSDLNQSNGLGWSPDGDTFYNADTSIRTIYRRSYREGREGEREVFVVLDGVPDGLTLDQVGNLWITIFDGERVECYSPEGVRLDDRTIHLPGFHPSSVEFIGAELGDLVITTGFPRLEYDADHALRTPGDGAIFVARTGARGMPATPWSEVALPR